MFNSCAHIDIAPRNLHPSDHEAFASLRMADHGRWALGSLYPLSIADRSPPNPPCPHVQPTLAPSIGPQKKKMP